MGPGRKENNMDHQIKSFELIRFHQDTLGTFGALWHRGGPFCYTYELPWMNNLPTLSCIPSGTYQAKLENSPKHGICYELLDVPGHKEIQFHVGNDMADSLGCVLLGNYHGEVWKGPLWERRRSIGVLESKVAFKKFMRLCAGDKLIAIEITVLPNGIK